MCFYSTQSHLWQSIFLLPYTKYPTKMKRSFYFAVGHRHKAQADLDQLPFLPVDTVRATLPHSVSARLMCLKFRPWEPPSNLPPPVPVAISAAVPNRRCGIAPCRRTSKLGWHFQAGNTMNRRLPMWRMPFAVISNVEFWRRGIRASRQCWR